MRYKDIDPVYLARRRQQQLDLLESKRKYPNRFFDKERSTRGKITTSLTRRNKAMKMNITIPTIK
jgi:hypothetical protein